MEERQNLYVRIVCAFENGITDVKELAKRFGVCDRTIRNYLYSWRAAVPVDDIRAPGRPAAITSRGRSTLARIVSDTPLSSSSEIASKFESQSGTKCTPKTIRNTLHSMGFKSSIPRAVPLLTDQHKLKRFEWSQANADRDWSRVIFTDETTIQLQANIVRAWHKNESRPTCPRPKFPKKAMFWAAVSRDFNSELFLIEGSVTAQSYVSLLREKFIPWLRRQKKGEYVFQQDNAPAHSARVYDKVFQ